MKSFFALGLFAVAGLASAQLTQSDPVPYVPLNSCIVEHQLTSCVERMEPFASSTLQVRYPYFHYHERSTHACQNTDQSLCLASIRSSGNGAAVTVQPCDPLNLPAPGSRTESWINTFGGNPSGDSGGHITDIRFQDDGVFCLDVRDGVNADGTRLQIWECNGGPNQKFQVNGDQTIQWVNTDKCLDLYKGINKASNYVSIASSLFKLGDVMLIVWIQVQLWTCNKPNTNRKWISKLTDYQCCT